MYSLEKIIIICEEFKNNTFGIEEFQSRIETVLLPDDCKFSLEKIRYNACNQLERIIYCSGESLKEDANCVAEELIQATIAEQARLKTLKPYN